MEWERESMVEEIFTLILLRSAYIDLLAHTHLTNCANLITTSAIAHRKSGLSSLYDWLQCYLGPRTHSESDSRDFIARLFPGIGHPRLCHLTRLLGHQCQLNDDIAMMEDGTHLKSFASLSYACQDDLAWPKMCAASHKHELSGLASIVFTMKTHLLKVSMRKYSLPNWEASEWSAFIIHI